MIKHDNRPIILAVDDDPFNIDILTQALREEYRIKIAINGLTALNIAQAQPKPDLILLDVMMPDLDGFTICQRLKADIQTQNIPIIFITGKDSANDEEQGLELGATDYIIKPIKIGAVKARVRNCLRMKQQSSSEKIETKPEIHY